MAPSPSGSNPSSLVLRWAGLGSLPTPLPSPPTYSSLPAGAGGQSFQAPPPSPAPHSGRTSTAHPGHHWAARRASGAGWLAWPSVRVEALITRPRASKGRARVRARRGLRLQVKRQFSGPPTGVLGGIRGRTEKGYCASCPSAGSAPCDGAGFVSSGWDASHTGSPRWAVSRVGGSGFVRSPSARPYEPGGGLFAP